MASVTYWKIDSQNNRVQVTEEFTPHSVGVGTYVADRCDHPEGNKSTPSSVVKSTASATSSPILVQVPNSVHGVNVVDVDVDVEPAVVIDN